MSASEAAVTSHSGYVSIRDFLINSKQHNAVLKRRVLHIFTEVQANI
jgi:hypothetical protein